MNRMNRMNRVHCSIASVNLLEHNSITSHFPETAAKHKSIAAGNSTFLTLKKRTEWWRVTEQIP